jgi:hypothetical protein
VRLPLATAHQRLVDGDAGQPSGERRLAAEGGEGREGLEVAILHRILGLLLVAQDAPGCPIEPPIVAPHDLGQRHRVARQGTRNQRRLARLGLR